jgi:serine/threonine protein kinase
MLALAPGEFRFTRVHQMPIGRGGLGEVYHARVVESNCPENPVGADRAVKQLNAKWKKHPAMIARFEREIATLKKMDHPNIVHYHGENLPGNERFYMMPLFSSSVRKLIGGGTMNGDWRGVAGLGAVIADALHYAHGAGFIHRDLKPDNLLFNGGGPLVVADWGIGYFIHQHSQVLQKLTVGGMGTEYYCSLEQWGTGKCDCRGDIYALGMTLDEWVTGRQRPISVGDGVAGASVAEITAGARQFNALMQRMTRSSKLHRPSSMMEVASALRAIAAT